MDKVLILDNRPSSWRKHIQDNGGTIAPVFRKICFLRRIQRKLMRIFGLSEESVWYDDWVSNQAYYDIIIVFIYSTSENVIRFLCDRKGENQRVIAWYWNPVYRVLSPDVLRKYDCELWSFDLKDCTQYNMKYNTTFYFREFVSLSRVESDFDVVFLGLNKGRLLLIQNLEEDMKRHGLKTKFHVVNELSKYSKRKDYISYDIYLEWINRSKCILDVLQENQQGATLRVMESLFFQKKLITTNKEIEQEEYYHPSNIFIVGKDAWENICDFISTPYYHLPADVVNRYEFKKWLNRFVG